MRKGANSFPLSILLLSRLIVCAVRKQERTRCWMHLVRFSYSGDLLQTYSAASEGERPAGFAASASISFSEDRLGMEIVL